MLCEGDGRRGSGGFPPVSTGTVLAIDDAVEIAVVLAVAIAIGIALALCTALADCVALCKTVFVGADRGSCLPARGGTSV